MDENLIKSAFQQLSDKAKNETDTYVVNGLAYCNKCRTPRQCKISVNNSEVVVWCLCKCESQKQKEEEQKLKKALAKCRCEEIRSTFDGKLRGYTFKNDDGTNPQFINALKGYCGSYETVTEHNLGLYIYGDVGNGKTYGATCIANHMIDNGVIAKVTSFPKIKRDLQSFGDKNAYIKSLNNCDFLIIDDFGVENQSEYSEEIIYSVIDERGKTGKPLIITSNVDFAELLKPKTEMQKRIYSRIVELCQPLKNEGTPRRISKAKGKAEIFKKIMEG